MLLADLTPSWPILLLLLEFPVIMALLDILLLLLEFPVIMALLDCWNRPEEHFADGAADRKAWMRWLLVAVVTVPILIGFGIVLGYYYAVVRRNSPASRS